MPGRLDRIPLALAAVFAVYFGLGLMAIGPSQAEPTRKYSKSTSIGSADAEAPVTTHTLSPVDGLSPMAQSPLMSEHCSPPRAESISLPSVVTSATCRRKARYFPTFPCEKTFCSAPGAPATQPSISRPSMY